jgi:hypothetical protein
MPATDDTTSTALRARIRRLRTPIVLGALAVLATTAIVIALLARRPPELGPAPQASRCSEPGRTVVATPRGSSSGRYSPLVGDDTTFDAAGSIWRPDLSTYPINIDTEASRICWVGGQVEGSIPESMTWEEAHGLNQPCLRIVATEWIVVDGLRCDNTDDGIRPRETGTDAQNVTMTIHDTYLTRVHDDCLENDGVIGGLLQDNLWDGCNTGISERPSDDQGGFAQPHEERLVLDRMLIGLAVTPHQDGPGENALFKWSDSANTVVIRCSVFKVDAVSLNGAEAMAIPGSVDDRACPDSPTTLVWLGGGTYPGRLPAGIRVTAAVGVWDAAVTEWTCRHDDVAATCGNATPS